jgi:hypothetical protein
MELTCPRGLREGEWESAPLQMRVASLSMFNDDFNRRQSEGTDVNQIYIDFWNRCSCSSSLVDYRITRALAPRKLFS